MKNRTETKEVELLSYEEAYKELIALIESLESEEHPLDENINLFERGQELAQRCTNLLEQAELKVFKLKGEQLIPMDE